MADFRMCHFGMVGGEADTVPPEVRIVLNRVVPDGAVGDECRESRYGGDRHFSAVYIHAGTVCVLVGTGSVGIVKETGIVFLWLAVVMTVLAGTRYLRFGIIRISTAFSNNSGEF